MDCTAIKELLTPKTLNKFRFALVIFWILLGAMLCGAFLEMENNEPRYDFRCDVKGNIRNIDFIRGKCFDQYRIENHKLFIPPLVFILVNVSLIPVVTVIYSIYASSTVNGLKRTHPDAQGDPKNRRRTLFIAYLCQLTISIALEITFILFVETHLFYPRNFPSEFSCSIENRSFNRTQSTDLFNCFNHRAGYKNVWIRVVTAANGIFAFSALLEIVWILSQARTRNKFMENWHFYVDHLKSNSDEQRQGRPKPMPLEPPEHARAQKDLQSVIQALKENCLRRTKQPSDLKQPFGRPNPGEGDCLDLTIDEIYVNVAIHEGRAHHYFAKDLDRWEQLKEYPPDAKDCKFAKPEDILDEDHKNVLVVGRPGIGKTSLSTKMLRLWASGDAFNGDEHYKADFNVVFLVKFRRFNDDAKLNLRELLTGAETVQRLGDSLWDTMKKESSKVLLIFDGVDEYSAKNNIAQTDDLTVKEVDVEEKMPVSVLYNKLAAGDFLPGASILTTTRPTAVEYVAHINFQRTVEILGFTSENVEEYVQKFTPGNPRAKEKIWRHIKTNINLFSLSYIPVNCFLICHCLLQIILSESSQALPTKMTDIYKMTVKMILFNHNREGFSQKDLERLKSTHMYEPFEKFPEKLKKILNSLGEIAFKGIEEGRLLFESSEVSGLEDCGLLHKLPDLKPKALGDPPKSQFCFTHLTVQEFFAAKHLVDTETNEGIERFVWKHINHGTWQVALQFVAGLLKSSSDIFIKLLPVSTQKTKNFMSSKPEELTFWPPTREDKDLGVQVCKCLYEINDEQRPVLQNTIKKIKFNAVEFNRCSLAPIDAAAVLHFLENAEEVLYFNLSDNELGDLGANEVKKFIVNRERKLKWLNLSENKFTDNAAKDFAAALKHSNCKLKSLDLRDNKFTDKAAKDFAAALKHSNCKLKALDLSTNNLTDKAARDFAAALKHRNCKLKSLYLSSDNFTEERRQYLTDAGKQSNCEVHFVEKD